MLTPEHLNILQRLLKRQNTAAYTTTSPTVNDQGDVLQPRTTRDNQGDVLQSIAKAIHQSPSPIHFHKVKSHAGIKAMNMLTLLLQNQSHPLTLRIPPSKQLALREIPTATSTGLQKKIKTQSYINQIQPSHLPQGFGTYPITMTPCKHTCTPSTK